MPYMKFGHKPKLSIVGFTSHKRGIAKLKKIMTREWFEFGGKVNLKMYHSAVK